eukprot:g35672.t1
MSQRIGFRLDPEAQAGICERLDVTKDMAASQLLVPFLQGLLYYANKVGNEPTNMKWRGKLWAYANSILPIVHACDVALAQTLHGVAWNTSAARLQCDQDLLGSCTGCQDSAQVGSFIAGYDAMTDVTQHALIDLDIRALAMEVDEPDYPKALDVYDNGLSSFKKNGALRTLKGFSVRTAAGKPVDEMGDEKWFKVFDSYWRSRGLDPYTYADQLSRAALTGTKVNGTSLDFSAEDKSGAFRAEAAEKAPLFFNVWYYVVWEMHASVMKCRDASWRLGTADALNWDEAVAFYTGSLEGRTRVNQGWQGESLFAKAQKGGVRFGTCTADGDGEPNKGYAASNAKLFDTFEAGKARLAERVRRVLAEQEMERVCNDLEGLKDLAVAQVEQAPDNQKFRGELWAYSSSILPLISKCDFNLANNLYALAWEGNKQFTYSSLKARLENIYPCLGITCADVGGGDACVTINGQSVSPSDLQIAGALGLGFSGQPTDVSKEDTMLGLLIAMLALFLLVLFIGLWVACSMSKRNKDEQLLDKGDVEDPKQLDRRTSDTSVNKFRNDDGRGSISQMGQPSMSLTQPLRINEQGVVMSSLPGNGHGTERAASDIEDSLTGLNTDGVGSNGSDGYNGSNGRPHQNGSDLPP